MFLFHASLPYQQEYIFLLLETSLFLIKVLCSSDIHEKRYLCKVILMTQKINNMKKLLILVLLVMGTAMSGSAADKKIVLPKHDLSTMPCTVEAMYNGRHSVREFSRQELSMQDLSNVLWAANGYNRPQEMKRTAPSAMNRQEVDVYVVKADGIYLYDAKEECLILKVEGDKRDLIAGRQEFAKTAPVSILLCTDVSKLSANGDSHALLMAAVDTGIVTENICLFCAAAQLANVPRASMDATTLKQLLGLGDKQLLLMNIPIGYFVNTPPSNGLSKTKVYPAKAKLSSNKVKK
jgi:SagB-type dehydrogenase family enzyme